MNDEEFRESERAYRADPQNSDAQKRFARALDRRGLFAIYRSDEGYVFLNLPERHYVNGTWRERKVHVEWSLNLLDNKGQKTQDEWVKWCAKNKWVLPDMPTVYSLISALYRNRNGFQPELFEYLRFYCRSFFLSMHVTSTRITYCSPTFESIDVAQDDIITHGIGSPEEFSIKENIGPTDPTARTHRVIGAGDEGRLLALIGTADIAEFNAISRWLFQAEAYISAWNKMEIRLPLQNWVTFGYLQELGAGIVATEDLNQKARAFGVRFLRD